MSKGMGGVWDLGTELCSAQGCPLPTGLTWPVGTLHVAAVPVGELGGAGWVSCQHPPLPLRPLPGSACPRTHGGLPGSRAGGARPPCPASTPGKGREHITVPNPHSPRAPQCPPAALRDPGVQRVPQSGAQPCTPLGWCPVAPQSQDPSPAPPRWLWSWGCHGRAQSQMLPPSSRGWPEGAGGSWQSAPSPSGPCCWCCSRGSAPRTTARGHLRGMVSAAGDGRTWEHGQGTPGPQLPSLRALTGGRLVMEGAAFAAWTVVVGVGCLEEQSRVVRAGCAPTPPASAPAEKGRERGWAGAGAGNAPRCTGRAPGTHTAARRGGPPAPAPAGTEAASAGGERGPQPGPGAAGAVTCRWKGQGSSSHSRTSWWHSRTIRAGPSGTHTSMARTSGTQV